MSNEVQLFLEILLTILFGAVLGLETETREIEKEGKILATKKEKGRIGGVRTYAILSLLGGIAGIFYKIDQHILVYILFIAVIGLILSAYILNVQIKRAFGLTTEIAVLIAFILGFLTTSQLLPVWLIIVILVMLVFFLSQKRGIGSIIQKIEHKEVIDVIKFSLVAAVILPILPRANFTVQDAANLLNVGVENANIAKIVLVNPFDLWLIVVIISGINLFGYFLSRMIGSRRGLLVTGAISGIISSTSAVISFASKSKSKENKDSSIQLAAAALVANSVSFLSLGVLMLVNYNLFFTKALIPFGSMFVSGLLISFYYLLKSRKNSKKHDIPIKYEPFSVLPAIKFVLIIVVITFLIQFLEVFNVNNIFVVGVTALSGVTGMEASTIAFTTLSHDGIVSLQTAVIALGFANFINFLAKSAYAFVMGNRNFAVHLTTGLLLVAIIGALSIVFVNF